MIFVALGDFCLSVGQNEWVTFVSLGHSLKSLLMGFIFSLEDKSNEWSTEDKLNVLSTKDNLNKGEQVERDGEHPRCIYCD